MSGEIEPRGAKNEALQIISATLLTDQKVTVHNIPDITDIRLQIELLRDFGVQVEQLDKHSYSFCASEVDLSFFDSQKFIDRSGKLRGSVLLAGPLLARFRKAFIPRPGGDKIGRRRLDTHINGFRKLGVAIDYDNSGSFYRLSAMKIKSTYLVMDEPSVTGTGNLIMASVFTRGTTTIYNAACEPYIQQLCRMLISMGAAITGVGSNLLVIAGVEKLTGTDHYVLPDMIEVGSFIGLAAMTQSVLTIKNAGVKHLGVIPKTFSKLGIKLQITGDDIIIPEQEVYHIETFLDSSMLTLSDSPWPGLSPDLLSVLLVTAIRAEGSLLIHQKMFESRLFFVDKLIEMGARIVLCDPHRAVVVGLDRKFPLHGIQMTSPDIRAGVALLIAALNATGKSLIQNIEQIDRGYEDIDGRLRNLGAEIKRIV